MFVKTSSLLSFEHTLTVLDLDRKNFPQTFQSVQNFFFYLGGSSLTISDGSFLPTCSNPPSGVMSLLSMEFVNSVFSAFLFKKTSPVAVSSPEMSYFTGSIRRKIPENIIKIERQKLPIV